jgi:hypothetical protein
MYLHQLLGIEQNSGSPSGHEWPQQILWEQHQQLQQQYIAGHHDVLVLLPA